MKKNYVIERRIVTLRDVEESYERARTDRRPLPDVRNDCHRCDHQEFLYMYLDEVVDLFNDRLQMFKEGQMAEHEEDSIKLRNFLERIIEAKATINEDSGMPCTDSHNSANIRI
jgi:hypothetical protein